MNSEASVTTKQINVKRVCFVSQKPFREILEAISTGVGHPNMDELWKNIFKARTVEEVDEIMGKVVGPSGLIEFLRFDHGGVIHKGKTGSAPGMVRLVVGNPSIMRRMAERVPDAGSYAPVTILVDERQDGTHLSYDRMTSFLETYGNEDVLTVARELDAKVEKLLASAAN
jgi:uncharacterized protein (DUF302 family)